MALALLTIRMLREMTGFAALCPSLYLLRMYLKFGEKKGFQIEVMEESESDVASIKSATIKFTGDYAYGTLRTETGIHRLVRKSPFDSNARSQHRNRDKAWQMLRARLYEMELRKQQAEQQKLEDTKSDIGWGHQIRSCVLDQSHIKDLRTNHETGNTQAVLDDDLDDFIAASLKQGVWSRK